MAEKKRTTNFSSEEVEALIKIVQDHQHIVENKKTDAVFNKRKHEEWEKIAKEFNCAHNSDRTVQAIKTKYENIKKTAKKKFATEKKQTYATGGGVPVSSGITPIDEAMRAILTTQITGFDSTVDSDTVILGK